MTMRILPWLLTLALAAPLGAQTPTPATPPARLDLATRIRTFDLVWETMRDRYYDRTLKGLDWNAIRREYEPQALGERDPIAFHAVLNRMVKLLDDSHLSVAPPATSAGPAIGGIGLDVVPGGERALVAAVQPDGPAALAGIAIGDEILAIDTISVADLAAGRINDPAVARGGWSAFERSKTWLRALRLTRGAPGTEVVLTLAGEAGPRTVRVTRAALPAHAAFPRPVFRRTDDGIGILTLTTFHADLDDLIERTFRECASCSALVIDVRGNSGGFASNIVALLDRLMAEPGHAGLSRTANGIEPLSFTGSGASAFAGDVAVLTDGMSASAAEVFAAAIQDLGRGRVYGSRTGGAVLLSDIVMLPSGGSQLIPFAEFRRATDRPLEGTGVEPDVVVLPAPDDLRAGRDAVLARALADL